MKATPESLGKVRDFNLGYAKDGVAGNNMDRNEITDVLKDDIENFAKNVQEARSLNRTNNHGKLRPASPASLSQMLEFRYGIQAPKEERADRMWAFKKYLQLLGVDMASYSLSDLSASFGGSPINKASLEATLLNTNLKDGNTFLIREVFIEAVRLGVLGISNYKNWIGRSVPISQHKVTVPQILKGEGRAKIIGEGEKVPFGSVKIGQKEVSVNKVGVGVEITDELTERSSIDMIVEAVSAIGEDMGLSKDYMALDVLKNGEQSTGIESIPHIGVNSTTDGITYRDIIKMVSRMRRFGHNANRNISDEETGLDVALLPEFKGFEGVATLSQIASIFGAVPKFFHDIHGSMDADTMILMDPTRAMNELVYRSMVTEQERDPSTGTNLVYFRDYVGFYINRRDARVLLDGSETYADYPFPPYMDVDAYQNTPFKS